MAVMYMKSCCKECKEQWLDTKLNFLGCLAKQELFFCPNSPQGLKLPDAMAAEMKGDIWKEPAVGVTCEPASAHHTAGLVCRDWAVVLWGSPCSPALSSCMDWQSRGSFSAAPAALGFGMLRSVC